MPPAPARRRKPKAPHKAAKRAHKIAKPRGKKRHLRTTDMDAIVNAGSRLDAALHKGGSHDKMIAAVKELLAALRRDRKRKDNVFEAIRRSEVMSK